MRLIKKQLPEPAPLSADQKYLHAALAVTFKRCSNMRPMLRHVDYLRVLDAYAESFTEDLIDRHPELGPHLANLMHGGKR